MTYPYIMKDSFISITMGDVQSGFKAHNIDNTHPNFLSIRQAIRDQNWVTVEKLIDPAVEVKKRFEQESFGEDSLVFDRDQEVVKYQGTVLHNTLTKRIFSMWNDGFDVAPMVKFLRNLLNNPSSTAVNELYSFLETGNMPITEDGHFLAYKKIRMDYKDIHSGTFDNSVGQTCEMPRNLVDDNRDSHCSNGLHFCSQPYLNEYGTGSDKTRVVLVKINPADVVSIPSDYNNTKGRTCKYEVYAEVNSTLAHAVDTFDKTVYPNITEPPKELVKPKTSQDDLSEYDEVQFLGVQLLDSLTSQQLVRVYNILTSQNLVKFRDKATGVVRLLDWVLLPIKTPTGSGQAALVQARWSLLKTQVSLVCKK